jgi:hypothetical protein
VTRGTTQFIDEEYQITASYTEDLVKYDVRSVLVIGANTYFSDPVWYAYLAHISLEKSGPGSPRNQLSSNNGRDKQGVDLRAFPNPFNPSTTFSFNLANPSFVRLAVFDVLGREVAVLIDGELPPGYKTIGWNASQNRSGTYYYMLKIASRAGTPSLVSGRVALIK